MVFALPSIQQRCVWITFVFLCIISCILTTVPYIVTVVRGPPLTTVFDSLLTVPKVVLSDLYIHNVEDRRGFPTSIEEECKVAYRYQELNWGRFFLFSSRLSSPSISWPSQRYGMAVVLFQSGPTHLRWQLLERPLPPRVVWELQCVSAVPQQPFTVSKFFNIGNNSNKHVLLLEFRPLWTRVNGDQPSAGVIL